MIEKLTIEKFLEISQIDLDTWDKAKIDWLELKSIAIDHKMEYSHLENSAELFAKEMQKFTGVHSVRWRVKDPVHLAEKIVRKRADNNPKYSDISVENYFERITDLVGVRALHLFKENCFEIDSAINNLWTLIEPTVAYIRNGDSEEMKNKFKEKGFEVKDHPAGYRSIHYVIESTPLKRKIITEIQVRTIFEEGWSEIDHTIRYPNFSDNELVGYFLEIFNRMAGSADDMGGFVLGLVATLSRFESEIGVITKEKEANFQHMEQALSQLDNIKKQDDETKQSLATLKMELSKLKEAKNEIAPSSIGNVPWMTIFNDLAKASSAYQAQKGLTSSSLAEALKASSLAQSQKNKALAEALKTGINVKKP